METTFKLVMFDLDGTLIETGAEIAQAVNATLAGFDFAPVTQQQINGWIGQGTTELLIQALASVSGTSELLIRNGDLLALVKKQFAEDYLLHCGTDSTLYPQVREVLSTLKSQGVKLAVVTNKEMRYTKVVLASHGLDGLFDMVIGGDTLPVKKPDPAGIVHCLKHFGVEPGRALFVGDSSIDAAAAKNAGVQVWLLPYGYNMNHDVHECAPDRVIDDFSALIDPAVGSALS
jgi:phosphoglycolate phosphatase